MSHHAFGEAPAKLIFPILRPKSYLGWPHSAKSCSTELGSCSIVRFHSMLV